MKESFPPSIQPDFTLLLMTYIRCHRKQDEKRIIFFFSFVSLIITLLGVYSAITLDTERRQKEVAIRKVNGADWKQIILLFARIKIYLLAFSAIIPFPSVTSCSSYEKYVYCVLQ